LNGGGSLTARETFVGELVSNVGKEIAAVGFGVEELLVLFDGKGEIAVDSAAMEAEV
jgi:hypothetical protein